MGIYPDCGFPFCGYPDCGMPECVGFGEGGGPPPDTTVQLISTAGNEGEIVIGADVPDEQTIEVIISGGTPYDGTYNPTAGELRDTYNFVDTIDITGTTGLGDPLTADDGLWGTPTGNLTLTRNFQSDTLGTFADIDGAIGTTYNITVNEQGDDMRLRVNGDDGVNTPLNAYGPSPAISIPEGGSAWVPTDVAGLRTWYDASDETSIAEADAAGRVSQISDLSGNVAHMVQGTAGNQPTTGDAASDINSLNTIGFNGTDQLLSANGIARLTADGTFFFVFKPVAPSSSTACIFACNYSSAARDFQFQSNNSSQWHGTINSAEGTNNNDTAVNKNGSVLIYCYRFNATTGAAELWNGGGTAVSSHTDYDDYSAASGTHDYILGGARGLTNTLEADFGEMFDYNTALSLSDINDAGAALATKWGGSWTAAT